MALHPELPSSPYATLKPEHRWFPADESLRASAQQHKPHGLARPVTGFREYQEAR